MLLRALFVFVCLPGIIAYALPLALGFRAAAPVQHMIAGCLLVAAGTLLLLICVREFYVSGRGTLAPWSPPRRLVMSGPYRYSRNPMYLGVIVILAGWATLWASRELAVYALAVLIGFMLRIQLHEEPWAARTFGAAWHSYCARVPRWLGIGGLKSKDWAGQSVGRSTCPADMAGPAASQSVSVRR
jgi:protein-S-isoprenylcysteine O-methyltransferase Ste14